MNEHVNFISKDVPVTVNISHDMALDVLTAVLYRMYLESVADDGRHTGNAA